MDAVELDISTVMARIVSSHNGNYRKPLNLPKSFFELLSSIRDSAARPLAKAFRLAYSCGTRLEQKICV